MRRAALGWLAAVALAVAPAAVGGAEAERDGVLYLFRDLQIAQATGFPDYGISGEGAGATASGGRLYGPRARVTLTLDVPHGYLRIDDRGDGDGATPFVTEVAVWFDREGFPLLGLSERALRGGVPFGGRVRFYSHASGRWNLVTDAVMPSQDQSLCRTGPQEVDESTAAFEGLGRAITLLPRQGTDLAVWCVAPSPVAGTGRVLEWDRATAHFTQGQLLPGPPPWPDAPAPR
ncbi:hypothetical protein [Xanthobacter sp. 126]|uniref:hypothetical protein n=1 Tax=Xanthobacter sp. 126 TaxID=1131814 RepID=UPI00045EB488|nr:hypothetical protein [Xanthobacter sp. 126]